MFALNRQLVKRSVTKCCSCVLGAILALSVMSPHVWGQLAPEVQEGNLFVGGASPAGPRGVFRVRDGVVTPFSLGSGDPGFFDTPHGVIVDSQGRVVWLAPLGAGNLTDHVCVALGLGNAFSGRKLGAK